jgi:hypothetical protein
VKELTIPMHEWEPGPITLVGLIDPVTGAKYLGKATRTEDGKWRCLIRLLDGKDYVAEVNFVTRVELGKLL